MDKISKSQVKLVRSLQLKKFRDELGLFVAEGEKCVSEIAKGFELVFRVQSTDRFTDSIQTDTLLATPTEIEQMSGLKTPQGVIGVFKKNTDLYTDRIQSTDQLCLALDGIQDPGNLGTIIRTCDWFGVHDIICSLDTADCYNPKVVQATMGALSRVHIHYVDLPEWLEEYRAQSTEHRPIYGTLLDGKNMYEMPKAEGGIIIMGNEGNGISNAVRRLITHPIRIPSYPQNAETSESLNVSIATGIVLAEFRRLNKK